MAPIFKTPLGYARIKEILRDLKIEPHDHQLEGIAASLDREDVIATMATGSGKTGFYTFLMLVILAISRDPALALGGIHLPANPAMLVVVPTRALQEDMKRAMSEFGLDAAVLNKDSLAANWNLWNECQEMHTVLLISPELLTSLDFTKKLLDVPPFRKRLCRFCREGRHLGADNGGRWKRQR
ncbi:hypothetical protein FA13DRAFT_1795364 [Coprinellus micaceus]|uniref:Helicase ATP-binding domain-containing protein n=1 Tax=Coprinellus micaceus TaxID=71717 RepID=A0A4Y7SXT6_COPMI|nr:hypothetical protein FA13DRAFT_1795364 [Coprinellus micaceus]